MTRHPPLRRTAPSPTGTSRPSPTCTGSSTTCRISMRTFPAGTPPVSRTCGACSKCAPPRAQPPICSRALPCTPLAPRSPAAAGLPVLCTSSHTVRPPFDSRQRASAFNQPLSFDTSSVREMYYMFSVRSSPCPDAPNLQSSPPLHAASTAVTRHLPPPGTLHLAPHRIPSVRLSAGRVGVQPAAELRHLQRQGHGRHVPRALLRGP
eukprot:scaffold42784_cov32-Phaeocystis_antarctica.AAC.1